MTAQIVVPLVFNDQGFNGDFWRKISNPLSVSNDLWSRVEEAGAEMHVVNGWLCIEAHGCTCGAGGAFGHQSGCGLEPLYRLPVDKSARH